MSGSEPWLAHGLTDGDTASCQSCGRRLAVRLVPRKAVIVTHTGALQGRILICTGCGRLLCRDCTVRETARLLQCDRCRRPVVIPMS
jgi:hypothetical protein